jgi:hypothetical protein
MDVSRADVRHQERMDRRPRVAALIANAEREADLERRDVASQELE